MSHPLFFELWSKPLVYVVPGGRPLKALLRHGLSQAAGRPVRFLVTPYWHLPSLTPLLVRMHEALRTSGLNADMTVMAPSDAERRRLVKAGLDSFTAHQNAFIDERIYYPEPGVAKRYRALHNAQTGAFKRHELARDVRKLALVTYNELDREDEVRSLVASYADLAYVNFDDLAGLRRLSGAEVRRLIAQSGCGLILSAQEGSNYASTEYLLCGAPVVTTPSTGGRDLMFDPRHVVVVDPTSAAVGAGVKEALRRAVDPFEVRRTVLDRMRPHRFALVDWLSTVAEQGLRPLADADGWLPMFRDKLRTAAPTSSTEPAAQPAAASRPS